MAVHISGVLKDGAGKPVQNCTIQLKARRNSTTVVVNTVASENPDEAGRYSMDVEYGQYSVILLVEGFPPSHAGTITVYEDSKPGTLNDFLGAMTEEDARPEALRRFELMVDEVARNASAVAQNTAVAKKSAGDAGTSAREAATRATDAAGSARAASESARQAALSAQSASSGAGTASARATEASKSAAAAESSKRAAAGSAAVAKTSETNAAASQQSAATSASTATTKASEAATSAREAVASKEAAKSSETSAASGASRAAASATAAGNAAKAAKTSETNARSSETAAEQSASAAAVSKTAAASSASAASASAGQAAASATAAGKSAESAASSASTATTKAGEATEQASAAVRSASAAKTSETNAKASETRAESSKTAAASSASSAAASASSASASKDEATRQASTAAGSASVASTKATEAAGHATAAALSKSTAESAATRAGAAAKRAEDIASAVALEDANTTRKGIVRLSNRTDSTSQTEAATPLSVKSVMDETRKKAPLDSPAFTGTPSTPTPPDNAAGPEMANAAFVRKLLLSVTDSAPGSLDTLKKLAKALGDDPNFAESVTRALSDKQPLNAVLTSLSDLMAFRDGLPYFSDSNRLAMTTITAAARKLNAMSTVEKMQGYLGLKRAAVMETQDDIHDQTEGRLAVTGTMGFGALFRESQMFTGAGGPDEFIAWCTQTAPGRYAVEQQWAPDIRYIIPDMMLSGIIEIKVAEVFFFGEKEHQRKTKLITFYSRGGDVYRNVLLPANSRTPARLKGWEPGYTSQYGMAGLLGNAMMRPDVGNLVLAACYGKSDSDARQLQRGEIYPGSQLSHVEFSAGTATGSGVSSSTPVCHVRGRSASFSLPGVYRALSGSQGVTVGSSQSIIGLFVRIR